ncbi:MAG: phosphoribosylaminoimidazolesuccinocarboxamide synthase [Firmicutes bacterium]|jgi:phosphoribosylaminoimidazole-succinocarboxamide synthase|nr:phosphoribosylaminoimidazolesuccinocarboxamide synthase [Bacillota bacterium]HKM16880.1 phosphoribosylaminoimidazolesuccinocarboxamide synthase [Limnochordia bacterium]
MQLVYEGKTKNVYRLGDGNYLLKFKDDLTGSDGVFDPGANTVGLQMEGAGRAGLRLTKYFFELLKQHNIPTHYLEASLADASMIVKPAQFFGRGMEVICRYRAYGSFLRRYRLYAAEGQPLDGYIEFTLKDDAAGDPLITKDGLVMLNILSEDEYETIKALTRRIADLIREDLAGKQLDLYDLKLEFGLVGPAREIAVIDEISGGNMRVFHNGRFLDPLELAQKVLA